MIRSTWIPCEPINKSQLELLNAVRNSEIHTFGWPIGITLDNREDFRPQPVADGIRVEIAIAEQTLSDRSSHDHWVLRSNGDFYLLKSLFEEERADGKIFFNTRIVRVTESLLFAANLYQNLGAASENEIKHSCYSSGVGRAGAFVIKSGPLR
jgi:hypothetical protein